MKKIRAKQTRPSLKLLMVLIGMLLIFCLFCCYLRNVSGNYISCTLAKLSANHYIKQTANISNYAIDSIWYDDKDEWYCVNLSRSGSADSFFQLKYNYIGVLIRNTYEHDVTQKWNTAIRLNNEYASAMRKILASDSKLVVAVGHCGLSMQSPNGFIDTVHCIPTSELELDGIYDLAELGARAGHVSIAVTASSVYTVTIERLAETLLLVRKTADQAGLPFYTIDCCIKYPNGSNSRRIDIKKFPYEYIFDDNLENRLQESAIFTD